MLSRYFSDVFGLPVSEGTNQSHGGVWNPREGVHGGQTEADFGHSDFSRTDVGVLVGAQRFDVHLPRLVLKKKRPVVSSGNSE